jgi:putative ABC transport system ATP-binding protein
MLVPANRIVCRREPRSGEREAEDVGSALDFRGGTEEAESLPCTPSLGLEHANTAATNSAAARSSRFPLPASLVPLRMLVARDLSKEYRSGENRLTVLRDVSFSIPQGAFVAIVGPSGSGKTTLLGLLAGLDTPSRGQVVLDGADMTAMDEDERAQLRGQKVGFVFQSFQLISTLTALENVQVPLELRGESGAGERARELLGRVGLGDRLDHFPTQLSGGEQQRVAIARAFANSPRILFADEPTGNLDSDTGARIVDLLESLNRESKTTIILVTHDLGLANHAERIIRLSDGRVIADMETERVGVA